MNRSINRNLALAAVLAYPAFALGADQAPDVKGKWIGKTHTIIAGRGMHWPKSRGTFDKPALLEKDLVNHGAGGTPVLGRDDHLRRRREDRRGLHRRTHRQGQQELRLRRHRRLLEWTTRRGHALVLLHAYGRQE
jgi:hypothetical protein